MLSCLISAASSAKLAVEVLVRTDPNPQPNVSLEAARDGAVINRHAHRPSSGRVSNALQTQTGMRWVVREFAIRILGGRSDFWPQTVIQLPEERRPARGHAFSSKSLSCTIGNCSGFSRYRASTSSSSASSLGLGLGSFIIWLHRASPSNSGTRFGSDSARRARSSADSFRIASSISSTVLTANSYYKGAAATTPAS